MTELSASFTDEKPQNGLAGFKYWRFDLLAGLQVALVSLPLSLGIAIASGAPPVTGLVSAIIAGFVYPILGGSYVTIAGPAAGLVNHGGILDGVKNSTDRILDRQNVTG